MLICSLFMFASIVEPFTLSSYNFSQSSIPWTARPFLGTIKKLHSNSTLLCLTPTLPMPNCGMLKLLCVCSETLYLCIYSIL